MVVSNFGHGPAAEAKTLVSIVMGRMFLAEPMPTSGQMAFADADNDMVADAPTDPAKLLNPEEARIVAGQLRRGFPSQRL